MNPVLCVTRNSVEEAMRLKPSQGNNVYPLDIRKVGTSNFHFLSRQIADSKQASDLQVAKYLPQLLPYVVVTYKDEVLTYSRAKGAEDRLHGTLSCGFGGHVDIGDIDPTDFSLNKAILRELEEELRLDIREEHQFLELKLVLIDTTNEVGQVHLGYLYTIELSHKGMIDPNLDEIHLPEWKPVSELAKEKDRYENWSQSVITAFPSN